MTFLRQQELQQARDEHATQTQLSTVQCTVVDYKELHVARFLPDAFEKLDCTQDPGLYLLFCSLLFFLSFTE